MPRPHQIYNMHQEPTTHFETTLLYKHLPLRPCVGVVLLNAEGNVFVGKRLDAIQHGWQMPQGGIDAGEALADAALRELEEEIGTRNVRVLKEADEWLAYDLPDDLVPTLWQGRFRGQTQKWFLMQFLGEDEEINLHTQHPEFSAWKWVRTKELPNLAIDFKEPVYVRLLEIFRPFLKRQSF